MMHQIDFKLVLPDISDVRSELAVKLHGALMHQLPGDYAEVLHRQERHPYALYVCPTERTDLFLCRVSALTEEARCVTDTVSQMETVCIRGIREPVRLLEKDYTEQITLDNVCRNIYGRRHRLQFITPSVYSLSGKPCSLPDMQRLFRSVLYKLKAFENCDISEDAFRKAFSNLLITDWEFRNCTYNLSGNPSPGLVGYADIFMTKNQEENALLKKVFAYAAFCGTGARCSMGMGGFLITKSE